MKWIGQHIYDLVARFRSDVYLDDISTGTIASGAHLGLDSNNKIVKAAVSSGGISFDGSTADGVLTYKDADEATVEQYLTFAVSSNISRLTLFSDQDTGDYFHISTTTHGATTLTTVDDDATAAHFEIAADGNITLDSAAAINLEVADTEFVDLKNGNNSFARFYPESGSSTIFSIFEQGGDSQNDYFSINVAEHGETTLATVDADAAAANLNFSIDGQFSIASTGIDIAGNGTITNATWQGASIGTAYTDAKVTSIVAGDGIDVSGATGDVTVTAETATASNPGIVELATDGETTLASDSTRAVTPASLGVALTAHTLSRISQIVNLKGYATIQDGVYDFANPYNTDDEAPFQLDTSYGSGTIDSSTELTQSKFFRSGGFHVPFACTISTIQVQVTCNNAGNVSVAIVEYRPSSAALDQNDYPRTVYETVVVASADNNNKVTSTTVSGTDLDNTAVPAGSHLMMMVKGDGTSAGGTTIISAAIGLSW